ncbi:AIPR family protein [Chromobacterium vaccinii]|uniref:AIPR family protein n=1 Tax=Chromobacterium vaccinii TaxID=1108595 RepID=UPI001E58D56F|nr:AIPR family protein [Chromobacterium vaccinii]MCD4501626.1 AIPR family protein [Chromobacterium vaccinii]
MEMKSLLDSIDSLAAREKLTRSKAFAAWYAINFGGLDEDDALESASIDGGNDQGIDIVYADEQAQKIFIIQSFVPGSENNFKKPTKKEKWNELVACIPFVNDTTSLRASGRVDAADLIDEIKNDYPNFEIAFGLISLGIDNVEIQRALKATADDGIYDGYHFFFEHQEKIIENYNILIEEEGGIPEETIHFSGAYYKDEGAYGEAYIGSISSTELVRLHNSHPNKIFSGNIRFFLGARKGGINEKIIKTAQENPEGFWALNNGVTIVADSIYPVDGGNAIVARRFSIVNGCQTTSCLVKAGKAGESAKVLARIIAAKSGTKNDIVLYNNSQNAVKIWAVRAADDTQEILKKQF